MNKPILGGAGGLLGGAPTVQSDNLHSDDIVEINLAVSEGPIVGLADGPKTFFLGETPLTAPSGELNFNKFELHNFHGLDEASEVVNALGGISSNVGDGVNLAYQTNVVRTTPSTLRNQIDSLELRFVFNQVYFQDNKGRVNQTPLVLFLEYRESGSLDWLPWFTDTKEWVKDLKVSQATVQEFTRQVPRISGDWEIRVSLQTESLTNEDDNTYEADVTWESFQAVTAEHRSYNNLAVCRILSEASDQFSGIPPFSGVWHGKIIKIPSNYDPVTRYYDGTWDGTFKDGFTDNPAWCLYNLLTNEVYGAKAYQPNLQADRYAFYAAAQWCDEFVARPTTGYQPRYTYNDIIQEQRDGRKMLHYIAGIFGGQLVEDSSGLVSIKVDKPGTITQIIGPESVAEAGFSYNYTDVETRPNYYEVSFTNPDLDWQDDVRTVSIPEFIELHGRTQRPHIAVGCIDVFEAQRRAYLRLLRVNTETLTVQFKIPRQALLLDVYDLIGISDPDMRWGLSGRVKNITGGVISLRDPLVVPTGEDMTFSVQTLAGVQELVVSSTSANTRELTIVSGTLTAALPDRAQFTLQQEALGLAKPFRILNIEEDSADPSHFVITALEFNANKFGDADALNYSGTTNYSSDFASTPIPYNLRADSGTLHLVTHTDGRVESRINVVWDQDIPGAVEVLYHRVGTDEAQTIQASGRSTYISNAIDGDDYEIEVRLVGGKSSGPITHTVVGKTALPQKVTGWTIAPGLNSVVLKGVPFPEADFNFFRIYGGEFTDTFETSELLEETPATSYTRVVPENDKVRQYWITAVDTSGNEGPPSTALSLTEDKQPSVYTELRDRINTAFDRHDQALDTVESGSVFDLLSETRIRDAILAAQNVTDSAQQVVAFEEVGDAAAAIVVENAARVSADAALAATTLALTARVGDNESEITDVKAVKVDANGAVAAVETEISTKYAGLTAMANATSFAEAKIDGIASGFLWKLNGSNVLELVSVADGVGGPVQSTARISADYVQITGLTQIDQAVVNTLAADTGFISNLTVDTINLAGKSVTVPYRGTGAEMAGDGDWIDAVSIPVTWIIGQTITIEFKWEFEQGYATLSPAPSWGVSIVAGDGTVAMSREGMSLGNDYPSGTYTTPEFTVLPYLGQTTRIVTYTLRWKGSTADITATPKLEVRVFKR